MCISLSESMSLFWYDLDTKNAGDKFKNEGHNFEQKLKKMRFLVFSNAFLLIFAVCECKNMINNIIYLIMRAGPLHLELPPGN